MAQNLNNNGLFKVLGLMSGTSLDGLDLCLVEFPEKNLADFRILAARTYSYSNGWEKKLEFKSISSEELSSLDEHYTLQLGKMVNAFREEFNLSLEDIDLIGSHGHTWFHQPENGITLQIGNRPSLASQTGIPVICDFRKRDVELGGQGAPLVPIGDRDLFPQYEACLNLGGFANISLEQGKERIAFDIGPCNLAMNHYCSKLGLAYDESGTIAASAGHNSELFNLLNEIPYYQKAHPKSLGREWLEAEFLPLVDSFALSAEENIATINRHISFQIAQSLHHYKVKRVLISGGGALNKTLIDSIGIWGSFDLEVADVDLLHFKEALIFAYLAFLKKQGKINVLASVTGASQDHSSGIQFEP